MKYYGEEAVNAPLLESAIYEYHLENNKDYPNDTAMLYFDRKISYQMLFDEIEKQQGPFVFWE